MKRILAGMTVWFMIVVLSGGVFFWYPEKGEGTSDLPANPSSEETKWRIGYCEGEPFVNFAGTLHGLLEGFVEEGWIENLEGLPYSPEQEDSRIMWEWLADQDTEPYLEFVEDAHYSFSLEPGSEEELISRLAENDLDLVITMGTYAGKTLANDRHEVPILIFSTSNPVLSGIIKSEEDSGRPHVWAHTDPGRDRRLIEIFYDLFEFQKMGVVHEDSDLGRVFAAVNDLKDLAMERDYEIASRFVDEPIDSEDRERYYSELLSAHEELSQEIDAFFISIASIEARRLEDLLAPFYENKIPVFSQLGTEEVRHGAVASVNRADFTDTGLFGVDKIVRVINGESPHDLPQVFVATTRIALNLKAAERVGFEIPFEVLLVADHIYTEIEAK